LIPAVVNLAREHLQAGKPIGALDPLWPMLLLDPPAEIHALVFDGYIQQKTYPVEDKAKQYLQRYAESTAARALALCRFGKATERDRAAFLLLEHEDDGA